MESIIEFDQNQTRLMEEIVTQELIDLGAKLIIMADTGGNILLSIDNGETKFDAEALATLAASNVGALNRMSDVLGEKDLPMMIIRGETDSIHFSKITDELLLLSIFSKDISIGFIRLKITNATHSIRNLI